MASFDKWLDELNPGQRQAVTFGEGPLLVVAGAGSGKTKTLASRVAHLIASGVDPGKILLLTFTRRAAEEMIGRAQGLVSTPGKISSFIWGGTFHSVANRLLRIYADQAGLPREFTILDQGDSEDMLDILRTELELDKAEKPFPRKGTCLAVYSRKVNSNESLEKIIGEHFPWCAGWMEELAGLFKLYIERKIEQNVLDYDDLLLYWYNLLEYPELAVSVESRFDHILVDEYQDTNSLQSGILRRMRQKNRNITAVGDDAQSIYSFRSATVRNMLDFPDHFPGSRVMILEKNYRSTQSILNTANMVIKQAREKYSKELSSARVEGPKPELVSCFDESFQDSAVIERILKRREEGILLSGQAVLFRAASHSASLEMALSRHNIPFVKYGGLRFLESAHIKDLAALLRIAGNQRDERAWFRVLQMLKGIGPRNASGIIKQLRNVFFDAGALSLQAPAEAEEGLKKLFQYHAEVRGKNLTPQALIERAILYYLPILKENYDNQEQRAADLYQLSALASGYTGMTQFLAELTLDPPVSSSDFSGNPLLEEDYLTLSTIHSAKGLEWNSVYIIHASDGWIPLDMSTGSSEEIEEELRLLYVAITRAKDYLTILWPERHYTRPGSKSDSHIYGRLSRFLNWEVTGTMSLFTSGKTESIDKKHEGRERGEGIRRRLKEMF